MPSCSNRLFGPKDVLLDLYLVTEEEATDVHRSTMMEVTITVHSHQKQPKQQGHQKLIHFQWATKEPTAISHASRASRASRASQVAKAAQDEKLSLT